MSAKDTELEDTLKTERIKELSKKAAAHFAQSIEFNIFEDGEDEYKIVRLKDKDNNPIYYLILQKLGAGAFGEVSHGVLLDIDQGIVIPEKDVAIKITDFTEAGTLGRKDIDKMRAETVHENSILQTIQQSYGFSIGARKKNVTINIDEDETLDREANIQEAIVAMPLHPGKDMEHRAHKNKFSYGSITFMKLASELCANLQALHENNIIHSDLKPANIIWDPKSDHANIVDFNRAKLLSANDPYVFSSSCSDKAYMANECFIEGQGYKFSKATDVYSLGKILTEKFNTTHAETKQTETLQSKKYLSYDQLLLKPFLSRMISPDPALRPTIQECTVFFKQIENKMQLDIEQPNNLLRTKLSTKIISLEIYANQLEKEIQKQHMFSSALSSAGLIADKNKKYEETIKTIELLTHALATPEINTQLLKNQQQSLYQSDAKANGFFSFKGRYQKIVDEVIESVATEEKKIQEMN